MTPPLPTDLPRFAQSFRCYIDHPEYHGVRLLTGDWQIASGLAFFSDACPHLARAGRLGFIACTTPRDGYGGLSDLKAYYGDAHYPALYWHWPPGASDWDWPTDEQCQRFADRNGYPLGLVKLAPGLPAPLVYAAPYLRPKPSVP